MSNFIATTSNKLNTIEIETGQLIFVQDKREIYLDVNGRRVPYQSIIDIDTEHERYLLENPLNGYYYVKDTNLL